ncbi:flagellar hook-basal body complex protein [Acetatifactor muris]|uniref:Flagellar hook protein FlgE n=1 Tax=Acetatifactor muris TaxID=879566 RepID=A0A2K4ZIK6_9FIRM|nr:flagellar hook-basal body complex protein [Acetatifactor muris]MCR2048646.1 flagellar hook-basal body complex protein [Acetatifactor muris]SOY30294.1 Flagellar hook protein FlgE [Acetatifactor muris]
MMRSLFSGVSGLKTHQTRMDVIGHNIANVNTVAYKSSSMTFASLMSQTTQRASGANATTGTGGVNARQIGLGVKTSAINVNITGQGASQSTGNPFDIMITGENFFVVSDGSQNYFTRDGSFYVDGAGNLAMTSIGYNVMGWQVETDPVTGDVKGIKKDTVSALRIMSAANKSYPPEATSHAYFSGIIDKNDTDVTGENGRVVNLSFYDSQGYTYTAKFSIRQSTDDKNTFSIELDKIVDSKNKEVPVPDGVNVEDLFGGASTMAMATTLKLKDGYTLDKAGNLTTTDTPPVQIAIDGTPESNAKVAEAFGYSDVDEFLKLSVGIKTGTPPNETITYKSVEEMLTKDKNLSSLLANAVDANDLKQGFKIDGRKFNGAVINFDGKSGKFSGLNGGTGSTATLNLGALSKDGNFPSIEVDFSSISSVDHKGVSTISATNGSDDEYNTGSGRKEGAMIGVSIQQNGMIYASYDNGMTKLLGQIATARFANASGLEKQADNLYSATLNSGAFDGIGVDITASGDYMSTGQLEMSNVDLSQEFTEMITTQRGFQANSRIITVSDTLLEELTNLKR